LRDEAMSMKVHEKTLKERPAWTSSVRMFWGIHPIARIRTKATGIQRDRDITVPRAMTAIGTNAYAVGANLRVGSNKRCRCYSNRFLLVPRALDRWRSRSMTSLWLIHRPHHRDDAGADRLLPLSDGRTYEVHHPELAMIGRSTVAIGLPRPDDPEPVYDRLVTVSLLHVMQAEPVESSRMPSS